MSKSIIWVGLVLVLYVSFIICEIGNEFNLAFLLNSLIVPVIAIAYFLFSKNKNIYFSLFLILYSVSEILGVTIHYILYYNLPYNESLIFYEYDYYIGSSLYVLGYMFLLLKITKTISFRHTLKNFKIHLIVLTALNIYLIYVLQFIVKSDLNYKFQYSMELVYNIIMLMLLSAALLSYFYRDNKKSLYLFIGALFIVFSEVIDIAYNYIDQRAFLSIIGTSLTLCAFYFFYQQTKLVYDRNYQNDHHILMDEY